MAVRLINIFLFARNLTALENCWSVAMDEIYAFASHESTTMYHHRAKEIFHLPSHNFAFRGDHKI